MRRRQLLAAAAMFAAAGAVAWLPAAAADATIPAAWWHVVRQSTPVGAVPAAPVPDDGSLPVQNGPTGVLAFSAVRFEVGEPVTGTLSLDYAQPAPPVPPVVDLCPASTHWNSGADQEWDARPAYECKQHVAGTSDGAKMVWQVGPALIRDGTLDVVLVPEEGDTSPFSVAFAAPTSASLVVAPVAPAFTPPPVAQPPGAVAAADVAPGDARAASVPAAAAPGPGLTGAVAAAAPVVAPSPPVAARAGVPAASPVADERPAGSRTVGAAALAGAAAVLMLRGLGGGRARGAGRSLLARVGAPSMDEREP